MDQWKIPAASIAVIHKERLVYAKGFGYTDTTAVERTGPNHLFRIASVSKLVTAAAVLHLVQRGWLDLDAPVLGPGAFLSTEEFGEPWQKTAYQITARHLLEHTSGFSVRTMGDPVFKLERVARSLNVPMPISRKQVIQWQFQQLIPYKPGSRYSYSNIGYVILHELIEQVSHMPYEEYVRDYILEPAGIRGMRLGKNLMADRHVDEVMYFDHPGAPYRQSVTGADTLVPRPYGGTDVELLGGAGGWTASAEDLARLMVAIDGLPGMQDILDLEAVEEMTRRGKSRYALGWKGARGERWWRTGTLTGSNALAYRLNEETSYVIIVNRSQWNGYRFNRTLHGFMSQAISRIDVWPSHDLFDREPEKNYFPWSRAQGGGFTR